MFLAQLIQKEQLNFTNVDANVLSFEFSRLRACALHDVNCDFISCGYLNTSKAKIKLIKRFIKTDMRYNQAKLYIKYIGSNTSGRAIRIQEIT